MHRYVYALAFAKGKMILDIACGEGYGTALLASRGSFVTGVDIAENAVAHARQKYRLPNLEFRLGSCSKIPLPDSTIDLVVSFETIEHHDKHEEMLAEIRRVLQPDGLVVVSSPDKAIYTDKPDYHNPFHVKELYRDEFEALFRSRFKNVVSLGQKVVFGSGIIPDGEESRTTFASVDMSGTTSHSGLSEATYNLVLASDAALPASPASFLDVGIDASQAVAQRDAQIQNLQRELRAAELQANTPELQALWKQLATLVAHTQRFNEQVQRLIVQGLKKRPFWQFFLGRKELLEESAYLDTDAATISLSPFFDLDWYLDQYPDVARSGMEPARHYADFGGSEGRQPGPLFNGPWYLQQNPDVAAAGLNPLVHYMKYGWAEGRPIRVSASCQIIKLPVLTSTMPPLSTTNSNTTRRSGLLVDDLQFPIDKLSPHRNTVVLIVHEASRTGAPILAWNMAEELRKRYNVVVLLRSGGPIEQALGESAAAVVRLPDHFPTHGGGVEAVVERLVTVYSPMYVIANSVETRYFVPDFEKMGVPVVALVHEFSSLYRPIGLLSSLFEMASQIVFPARTVAEAAAKDYRGLEARDFKILPQGQSKLPSCTNPSTTNAPGKKNVKELWPADSENSLLVVGMGTINIRKGVDFFISTASAVHRAMPNRAVRFAWVGNCDSSDQFNFVYLKEQIERSCLSDTFAFIEEVEDLKPIYDQADIFFLSSRLDPLPNVAIDSAFNGIPVVCFDRASGMAEILAKSPDTRELVVPYLDAGAAAQLICNLADNPARLARLSQAVRTVAEAHFNMARYVAAIDELGRNAKTVRDQVKRDHALISGNDAFRADLYLGTKADTLSADEGLSRYLYEARLAVPLRQPLTGLLLRRPMEGFHPLIYASDNPQYDEASGENPLAHFIHTGRPYGRWTHQVLRPDAGRAIRGTSLRVAVHGHFHYPELLPDFIARLKRNAAAIDLYLTTTNATKAEELSKLIGASHFARTEISVVPNRGRDIGPMLSELGESVLSDYDIVGHFHGKRSAQFDEQLGERWRVFLWEHLIGGEFAIVDVVLGAFAKDEGLGLVFAEEPHLYDWNDNRACADELARRMGLTLPLPNHFEFPMGTMFWARPEALKPLFDLKLTFDDYPHEPLPIDGTVLHALERLLPFSAEKAGYRYATTYVKSWTR